MNSPATRFATVWMLLAVALTSCTGAPRSGGGGEQGMMRTPSSQAQAVEERARAQMSAVSKTFAHIPNPASSYRDAAHRSRDIDFSQANCKDLTTSDLQRYVDPRITGRAKADALLEMQHQPKCHRENVEGIDEYNAPYSNTWEGLQEVTREVTRWKPLGNGQLYDNSGEVITPSHPIVTPSHSSPHYGNTGEFYKYNSPAGHSAASGLIEIPECGWINNVYTVNLKQYDVPYFMSGGTVGTHFIDAGLQWNDASQSLQIWYLDNDYHTGGVSGATKYSCTLANQLVYLRLTVGVISNKTAYAHPKYYVHVASVYADGSPGPYAADSVGPLAVSDAWSIACSTCTAKREMTIAQQEGTTTTTGTNVAMNISTQGAAQIRTPMEEFINFEVGTFQAKNFVSAGYLWNTYAPQIDPSTLPGQLKVLTILGPNSGTETPGFLLKNCKAYYSCYPGPGVAAP